MFVFNYGVKIQTLYSLKKLFNNYLTIIFINNNNNVFSLLLYKGYNHKNISQF